MRSFLLALLWPGLSRAIAKLKTKLTNTMPLTTDEEVQIIEAATVAVGTLQSTKAALAEAKAALEPLQADNAALTATVQKLTDEDGKVDTALEGLRAALPAG